MSAFRRRRCGTAVCGTLLHFVHHYACLHPLGNVNCCCWRFYFCCCCSILCLDTFCPAFAPTFGLIPAVVLRRFVVVAVSFHFLFLFFLLLHCAAAVFVECPGQISTCISGEVTKRIAFFRKHLSVGHFNLFLQALNQNICSEKYSKGNWRLQRKCAGWHFRVSQRKFNLNASHYFCIKNYNLNSTQMVSPLIVFF